MKVKKKVELEHAGVLGTSAAGGEDYDERDDGDQGEDASDDRNERGWR